MALEERGIQPVALSGASAGALVAAMWATGMDPGKIREELLRVRLADFVDLPRPMDLVRGPVGLLGGRRLEKSLGRVLGTGTFEECRVPLHVGVYDLAERRGRTVSSGPLAPAVRASLSLPFMFGPATVDGRPCWDGGIVDRTPVEPLASMENVDRIYVSFLRHGRPDRAPRTLVGGMRSALLSVVQPAGQRAVDAARALGKEVLVIAPVVPPSGPHRLSAGPEIVEAARKETARILDRGELGCEELR